MARFCASQETFCGCHANFIPDHGLRAVKHRSRQIRPASQSIESLVQPVAMSWRMPIGRKDMSMMTRVPGQTPGCLFLRLIIALALTLATSAARCAAQQADFSVTPVADGDYAHFGQVAETGPDNAGDTANIGIIIGRDAVAVIDTGGSVQVG